MLSKKNTVQRAPEERSLFMRFLDGLSFEDMFREFIPDPSVDSAA